MRRNILILLTSLFFSLFIACQQNEADNNTDGEEPTTEAVATVDEASFLDNSVAKGVLAALEKEQPFGTEVRFSYVSFDPGAMAFTTDNEGFREIDELAAVMNANPKLNIVVEAFVDPSDSGDSDPERVANMRTFFIKSRLIDNGVSPQMIGTNGRVVESPDENRLQVKVLGE